MFTTAIVVLVFSAIQSLFGMGLLVFGTPTMLLFGNDFSFTLATLLPPSITISSLQLFKDRDNIDRKMAMNFIIFCLPFVALSLGYYLYTKIKLKLELGVAIFLIISLLLRTVPSFEKRMQEVVLQFQKPFLVVMGVVHGFTNMGGALLSVFSSSQYTSKEKVLNCVAFCYLFFALFQIIVLAIFQPEVFSINTLLFSLAAAIIYLTLGRFLFSSTSQSFYKNLFSGFMLIYAILLVIKGLGLMPHK